METELIYMLTAALTWMETMYRLGVESGDVAIDGPLARDIKRVKDTLAQARKNSENISR